MTTSLLDQILDQHTNGARIVSEQHDTSKINYGGEKAVTSRRPSAPWDEAEYGISLAEAQKRYDAQTPEAREQVIAELMARAIQRAGLDTSTGKVAVVVAGLPAWHELDVRVDRAVSSAEAIQVASLDWRVEKLPLSYTFGDQSIETDSYGIVRMDTGALLGVGKSYKPIQNQDGFSFLDGVLEAFGAKYESAVAVDGGGKKVFLLAKLPELSFRVTESDTVEPFVAFINSHEPGESDRCFPTAERIVCRNTLNLASRKARGKGLTIPHTGDVKAKIARAQDALGLDVEKVGEYRDAAAVLVNTPVNIQNYANDVLNAVLDVTAAQALLSAHALAAPLGVKEANQELARKSFERKIERRGEVLEDILERYESERCGIDGIRGSAWSAFNAVTEHADHGEKYKGTAEEKVSRRFESTLYGDQDELKQIAYELALQTAS